MERTFTQDDRIRRAEEIYAKRKNLRERTKRATVSVAEPKNFKLLKRLFLQIVICSLIYYIFYLISTTNYSFSESTLAKTKELVKNDFDFYHVYEIIVENINQFLYQEENQEEKQEENEPKEENNENQEENTNVEDENVNQSEVSYAEESELERIKRTYSFILPVSSKNISSEFGEREVTASVVTAYHKGIDIAENAGEKIVAATDGEVIISRYSPSYGNYVMIQNNEIKTVYAHCSELLVQVGDKVSQGKEIAKVGATGDVTGAHLHFEIRINDVCIDPRLILEWKEA